MKVLFNVICGLGLLLLSIGLVHSLTTSDPWPNETRNTIGGLLFVGGVCFLGNRFWNSRAKGG